MKKTSIVLLLAAFLAAGCESMGPNAKTGTVAGGLIGATAGGIIGYQSGNPLAGAGIGAAVGALGGALVGSSMDEREKQARAINPNYLGITSIVDMASKGVPDDVIIGEIQRTRSSYQLTSETISYLKQNKVSDKVINYMLGTNAGGG